MLWMIKCVLLILPLFLDVSETAQPPVPLPQGCTCEPADILIAIDNSRSVKQEYYERGQKIACEFIAILKDMVLRCKKIDLSQVTLAFVHHDKRVKMEAGFSNGYSLNDADAFCKRIMDVPYNNDGEKGNNLPRVLYTATEEICTATTKDRKSVLTMIGCGKSSVKTLLEEDVKAMEEHKINVFYVGVGKNKYDEATASTIVKKAGNRIDATGAIVGDDMEIVRKAAEKLATAVYCTKGGSTCKTESSGDCDGTCGQLGRRKVVTKCDGQNNLFEQYIPCCMECAPKPCATNPCKNGGQCSAKGSSYTCQCKTGYQGNNCELKKDACDERPCNNGGKCTVSSGGDFKCDCASGFGGTTCDGTVLTARNCADVKKQNPSAKTGMYKVNVAKKGESVQEKEIPCNMDIDGGGWTVLLVRKPAATQQNFDLNWNDYKIGFSSQYGELFAGLEFMYGLTNDGLKHEVRVDMVDYKGNARYAKYGNFKVAGESDKYRLTIEQYSGNAGDSFSYQNKMRFTCRDQDNDLANYNCALEFHGGWWYNQCSKARLTGLTGQSVPDPTKGYVTYKQGILWTSWLGMDAHPKDVVWMSRPV